MIDLDCGKAVVWQYYVHCGSNAYSAVIASGEALCVCVHCVIFIEKEERRKEKKYDEPFSYDEPLEDIWMILPDHPAWQGWTIPVSVV